jgi:choice-of-anchor B domain-containing protein
MACGPLLFGQASSNMTKVGGWTDPSISPWSGVYYNDIWGYVDGAGNEYAIIGSPYKVYFINVTNPASPTLKQSFTGGASTIWRDFKTYGTYAYGCADQGSEGLLIFDLSALPSGSITQLASLKGTGHFNKAHNIYIDVPNKRLYVAGSDTRNGGYIVYDLTNPAVPVKIADVNLPGGYIHDIFVRDNIAYCNHEYNGAYIYNVTNAASPVFLDSYSAGGYNHSCWLTDDSNYLIFAEEVPAGKPLVMLDVTNKSNISLVTSFKEPLLAPTYTNVTPHNPFVKGDLLYVSYYEDGTVVFDISNPAAPVRVAYYDTYPNASYSGTEGNWGTYPYLPSGNIISSDINTGLYVFSVDIVPPPPPPTCLVDEGFSGGQPAGWSFVATGTNGQWRFNSNAIGSSSGSNYPNPGSGNWAYYDDDAAGNNAVNTATATSPTVDINSYENVYLTFKYNYTEYNSSPQEFVRLRVWDGALWQYWNGSTWTASTVNWLSTSSETGTFSEVIPTAFYNANFKVELYYNDNGGYEWGFGFDDFKICGNLACSDNLDVSDNPIADDTYQSNLTLTSNSTVPSGHTVIFESAEITLQDGFHAQAGCDFTARTGACPASLVSTTANGSNTPYESANSKQVQQSKLLAVEVQPNPVRNEGAVRYFVPEDGTVQIYLFDLNGNVVQTISQRSDQAKGWHEIHFNTNNLPTGVYLLSLRTQNESATKKVVVLK